MRVTGKHRLRKIEIVLMLTFVLVVATGRCPVRAASADITFSSENAEVSVGESVTVLLQITADTTIGDFEGYLCYDANLLEYVSGPACITGGAGYLKIYDVGAKPSDYLRSYSMEFRPVACGISRFELSGAPMVYAYETGNSMSVMAEPYSIKITASANASGNADIETLRISPGSLTPEFASDVTEYSTTLAAGTERLIVGVVPQDMTANVQISGNEGMVTGINEIRILLTAENGTEKLYRIWATVEEGIVPPKKEEPLPEAKKELHWLTEEAQILCGGFRYRLIEDMTGVEIPEGYEATELFIDGVAVKVYQKPEEPEWCLMALENVTGEKGLYQFDRTEYTIQRYRPAEVVITSDYTEAQRLNELLAKTKEYEKNMNQMSLLAGALGAVVVLLLLIVVRQLVRSFRGEED